MKTLRQSPVYIDHLRSFRDIDLTDDVRGIKMASSRALLAVHSPLVRAAMSETDDAIIVLAGFGDGFLEHLDRLVHEGQVLLRDSSELRDTRAGFSSLGMEFPEDFWTAREPVVLTVAKAEPAVEIVVKPPRKKPKTLKTDLYKQYECAYCPVTYRSRVNFEQHTLRHERGSGADDNRWFCLFCTEVFPNEKEMNGHKKELHENEVVQCQFCPKTFTRLQQKVYENHVQRHQEKRVCSICGKIFANRMLLNSHTLASHRHDPVECGVCGKTMRNKVLLGKHVRRTHAEAISCPYCGKLVKSKASFQSHILSAHTENDQKPFQCTVCGKGFARKGNFQEHQRIHENLKPYKCQICSYSCASIANRNKHERQKHKLTIVSSERKDRPFDNDIKYE